MNFFGETFVHRKGNVVPLHRDSEPEKLLRRREKFARARRRKKSKPPSTPRLTQKLNVGLLKSKKNDSEN